MNSFAIVKSRLQDFRRTGKNVAVTGTIFESFWVQAQIAAVKELCCATLSEINKSLNSSTDIKESEGAILYNHCILTLANEFKLNSHPDVKRAITKNVKLLAHINLEFANEEEILINLLDSVNGDDYLGTEMAFEWLESLVKPSLVPDLWIFYRFANQGVKLKFAAFKLMCKYPDSLVTLMRRVDTSAEQSMEDNSRIFEFVSADELDCFLKQLVAQETPIKNLSNVEWLYYALKNLLDSKAHQTHHDVTLEVMATLVLQNRFLITDMDLIDSFTLCTDIKDKQAHLMLMCSFWDDKCFSRNLEKSLHSFFQSNPLSKPFLQLLNQSDFQQFRGKLFQKCYMWQTANKLNYITEYQSNSCLNSFFESFSSLSVLPFIEEYMKTAENLFSISLDLSKNVVAEFLPMFFEKSDKSGRKAKYPMICEFFKYFASLPEIPTWFSTHIVEASFNLFLEYFSKQDSSAHGCLILQVLFQCVSFREHKQRSELVKALFANILFTLNTSKKNVTSLMKVCADGGLLLVLAQYMDVIGSYYGNIDKSKTAKLQKWFVCEHTFTEFLEQWDDFFSSGDETKKTQILLGILDQKSVLENILAEMKFTSKPCSLLVLLRIKYEFYACVSAMFGAFRRMPLKNHTVHQFVIDHQLHSTDLTLLENKIGLFKDNFPSEADNIVLKTLLTVLSSSCSKFLADFEEIILNLSKWTKLDEIKEKIVQLEIPILEAIQVVHSLPFESVQEYLQNKDT